MAERAPLKKGALSPHPDPRKAKSMTMSHLPSVVNRHGSAMGLPQTPRASRSLTHNYYYPKVAVEEIPPEQVAESGSILLMIFINFLSNVVFSIVLPSLPGFINYIEHNNHHEGDSSYLNGWAVAVNSLGTFLASPIFGWWADKRNFREVFFLSLVVMVLSNIWYAMSPDVYQLFASRFLVGVAAANYAPASAYLSYATSAQERAKIMAWNSAATVLGFICGPAFSLVTAIPSLTFSFNIGSLTIAFNEFTAAGWISALFGLIGLFAMIPFKEVKKPVSSNPGVAALKDASMRSFRSFAVVSETSMPLKGVLFCLWNQFVLTSAFTIFETIGPLYTAAAFPWGDKNLYYTSLLFLGISIVSLIALFSLQIFLKFTNERYLMIFFSFWCCLGTGMFFEWENGYVSLPRFLVSVFFASTGYATASAMLLAVFTKVVSETEQGVMMGWLSSVGSMSRMSVPIFSAYVFQYFGPNYIFLCVALVQFVTGIAVVVYYDLTLPLIPEEEEETDQQPEKIGGIN